MISSINKDLRSKGHAVTLEILKDGIFIRGTFPVGDGTRKRKRISTGIKADPKSAPLAEDRAISLLAVIKETGSIPDPLPWENKKIDKSGYPKIKVKDAILLLKEDFFSVNTKNPISRNNTWNTMRYGLEKLDPDAYLTADYLAAAIVEKSKDPVTGMTMDNTKLKLKQYYKRLGNIAGLPDVKKIDKIEVVYESAPRVTTDLGDLLELTEEAINHPRYGWLTCCMIIYGCRPSETLSLIPSENGSAKVLTIKKKKGLPTWRTTMAIPKDFPEKLNLFEINRPVSFEKPEDFDPVRSKQITDQWGRWLKKLRPELTLYDLRHSWARRSIVEGVPSGLASRCLGHSITIFEKTYLSTTSEKDVVDYLNRS